MNNERCARLTFRSSHRPLDAKKQDTEGRLQPAGLLRHLERRPGGLVAATKRLLFRTGGRADDVFCAVQDFVNLAEFADFLEPPPASAVFFTFPRLFSIKACSFLL
ncbi:hypothetical protein ISCGN_011420 [Ixodes scapularis]